MSFAARIVAWQRAHGRHDLPWQAGRDAYRVWLSEVMLQQTQVATVLPYFARFVAEFPTVETLAAAPLSRVLALWSGLGYYRRAHHLHAAARIVVERHDGRFPGDAATLAMLPGIGRSTAAAIAAFASGERGAILDGNVKRVLARHRGIDGWPGTPQVAAQLWRSAEALLPSASDCARDRAVIADYTQGMMDVGATICARTKPRCGACAISDDCVAHRESRVDTLPSPRPRRTLPRRAVILLLLDRGDAFLFERRPAVGVWGGLWSLPEVRFDGDGDGSDIDLLVSADIRGRFGIASGTCERLAPLKHVFTHFALTMHPVRVALDVPPHSMQSDAYEWLTCDAAIDAALPSPIRRLIRSLDAKATPAV
jgi:A/G-specific adenine glycosylase